MAIDSSHPPSPSPDFPAEKTQTNRVSPNEARKNLTYKTKEIKFRKQKKRIILQNENGPCPLIAICNVLLLRNQLKLSSDRFQVSQKSLLSLLAEKLLDSDDAIILLPSFADGINVNIKFRRIDDFELTPELAILDLLKISLYHGWIVDPQDFETATAIGCKSYNDLMTGLVTLETQTVKATITPSAEHSKLGRGDIEEERLLLRALRLSEREKLGIDTRRDSSSGGESVSGYSGSYLMSEDGSLVDSMDAESTCTSTPGSGNISHKFSETDCVVENKIDVGEEICSPTSTKKFSGALDSDHMSSTELGDETACDVEPENSSKTTDVHVTSSSDMISTHTTNLESTDNDSSSEISLKSEAVTFVNPDLTGRSQDDVALYEAEKCVSLGSPVYKDESLLGKSSSEGKVKNGLTPREGEVIKKFLNNNASQLTFPGLFKLEQGLKEGELCVFFRNNHFSTMLKYDNALYNLVTDQGYLNERDVAWEKLDKVNGDSVFVTGDFKVFKCDSGKWDQESAFSITADFIHSINSSAKEGMEIDPDLKIAMELQKKELGQDIDYEVSSIKKQSHVFFNTRRESSPKMVQRWQMYNHVYIKPPHVSSFLCK